MKRVLLGLLIAAGLTQPANAQVASLEFAARPRLVQCMDGPCVRLVLNALDAQERPVALRITNLETALTEWQVLQDGQPARLFFVGSLESGDTRTVTGRYVVILLDVSGSMKTAMPRSRDTRFAAAKKAILSWTASFADGVDHVAVVPFESHHVASTIRNAQFASTAADLRQQVAALPEPEARNNTALYTAVVEALAKLAPYGKEPADNVAALRHGANQLLIVVLTDGANDVRAGDDPGLLVGAEGLDRARRTVAEASVQLVTIGFGTSGQMNFDEHALRMLAWPGESNYRSASTAEALEQVLGTAREKVTNRVRLTLGPVAGTKDQLAGRTVTFKVVFTRAGQPPIESSKEIPWVSPPMSVPVWEGRLDTQELDVFLRTRNPSERNVLALFRRFLILAIYAALLALLWFIVPRMIWPERYVPRPVLPASPGRPEPASSRTMCARPGAPAPRGGGDTLYRDPKAGRQPPADQTVYIRPDMTRRPDGPPGRKGRDDA